MEEATWPISAYRSLGFEFAGLAHGGDHQRREGVAALVQSDRIEAVEVPDPLGAVEYDAVAGTLDPRMISA